jgi:hypothetical protein
MHPKEHGKSPLLQKQINPVIHPKDVRGLRDGLIHAMRGALASGDAPAANQFYRALNGPATIATLGSGRDQVSKIKGWLANQH